MEQKLIKVKEELARELEKKIKEREENKRTKEILENLSKEPAQEFIEILANENLYFETIELRKQKTKELEVKIKKIE